MTSSHLRGTIKPLRLLDLKPGDLIFGTMGSVVLVIDVSREPMYNSRTDSKHPGVRITYIWEETRPEVRAWAETGILQSVFSQETTVGSFWGISTSVMREGRVISELVSNRWRTP